MANNLITALKAVGAPVWLEDDVGFEFDRDIYKIQDDLYVKVKYGKRNHLWRISPYFTDICNNPERIICPDEEVSEWNW